MGCRRIGVAGARGWAVSANDNVVRLLAAARPFRMMTEPVTVHNRLGFAVCQLTNETLTALVVQLMNAERARDNLVQDACECAMVPVSLYDAMKQALAEVAPDHAALQTYAPAFGVWEMLSRQLRAAGLENTQWRKAYAALRNVPCGQCDGTGMVGSSFATDNDLRVCEACLPPSTETHNHE